MDRVRVTVAEGYARWAPTYDSYANGLILAEEPLVRAMLSDVDGKRVLDVGCGTGRYTVWLASRGARVTGVDESEAMLAVARGKREGLDLRQRSLGALALDGERFDVVLCALVLEHVADARAAIFEMADLVASGGELIVSVFHPHFMLKGVPPHFKGAGGVEYEMPGHRHLVSDYVRAALDAKLVLTDLYEPIVDDAIVERLPSFIKHHREPIGLVMRARK